MNDQEANRQIDQMVMFIKQEAEEKAQEILMSAEEEFNVEKLKLLETEKQRIRKEYERKEAQVEANKKIESSKQLNDQRLKILQAKEDLIVGVFKAAKNELKSRAAGKAYVDLLADLVVQAMNKMQDQSQVLQCRKADLKALEAALPIAQTKFSTQYGRESPQATIDRTHFLPAAATSEVEEDDPDAPTCLGGVVATSIDGRIVCNNTLDARLKIVQEEQLPAIRSMLFD